MQPYYYRARYYDSTPGRFLSEDPRRFRAGVDFFSYVRNNSPDLVDPFGLLPSATCGCRIAGGAIAGGIAGAALGKKIGGILGGIGGVFAGGLGGFGAGELADPAGGGIPGAIVGGAIGGGEGAVSGSRAGMIIGGLAGAITGGIVASLGCSDVEGPSDCRQRKSYCVDRCLDRLDKGDHGAGFHRCVRNCMDEANCP